MNDFKKTIQAIDAKMAFIVVAAGAILAFLFFLILPSMSTPFNSVKGTELFDHSPLPLILMALALLLGPIGMIVMAFMKKTVHAWIPGILCVFSLFVGTYLGNLGMNMGIGSIFNLIIYAALTVFCYFRKGAPISFQ